MYLTFDTGKNQYNCILNTLALVDAESVLKTNPINIFVTAENELPKLNDLLVILYMSMRKFNHGIKLAEIYDIYDDYIDNGGDFTTLMVFIMNLFEESGIMKTKKSPENKTDNTEQDTESKN